MQIAFRSLFIAAAIGPPLATTSWWMKEARWDIHCAAAAACVASYCLAGMLLAAVFWNMQVWRRAPKQSPLVWAVMIATICSVISAAVFFLTMPAPVPIQEEQETSYMRWLGEPKGQEPR